MVGSCESVCTCAEPAPRLVHSDEREPQHRTQAQWGAKTQNTGWLKAGTQWGENTGHAAEGQKHKTRHKLEKTQGGLTQGPGWGLMCHQQHLMVVLADSILWMAPIVPDLRAEGLWRLNNDAWL